MIPAVIKEAAGDALARVPAELLEGVVQLIQNVASSPNPKEALARALQVTAHEQVADAAVDALFEGKKHLPKL